MRKINLIIIGGSYKSTIGNTHINSILLSNKYNIKGYFFSRKKPVNEKTTKIYNLNKKNLYFSLDQLLEFNSKNIDVAVVLVPPSEKLKIFRKVVKYNIKNIISEKPLSSNYRDSILIKKLLKKNNTTIYTTYNYLGYPALIQMKNMLNKIGSPKAIEIQMPQETFVKKDLLIAKWRKSDGKVPIILLDLASHCLSFLYYFYKPNIKKYFSHCSKNKKLNIAESFDVILEHKDFYSKIFVSKSKFGERNNLSIKIFGKKGSLKWFHNNPEEIIFSNNKNYKLNIKRSDYLNKIKKNLDLFTYKDGHPNGFIEAFTNIYKEIFYLIIKTKTNQYRPFLLNIDQNLNIIRDLEKISKSAKLKKWVK